MQVLQCGGCGAPVALGRGDVAQCGHCRATVAVPAEHRALRQAADDDAAARGEAQRLYEELGRVPTRLQRVMGVLFHPLALLLLLGSAMLIAFMLGGMALVWSLSPLFRANLWDVLPDAAKVPLVMVPTAGAFAGGVVLGVYGRRRVLSRGALQAALAAAPPAHPGGEARCRVCGAPLEVAPGALGARCLYCRADNLVALPPEWVAAMRRGTSAVAAQIEAAAEALRSQQRELRRSLAIQLTAVLGVLGLIVGAAWFASSRRIQSHASQDWNLARQEPPVLVRRQVIARGARWKFLGTLPLGVGAGDACRAEPTAFSAPECDPSGCTAWYYAALARGERLHLTTHPAAPAARVQARMHTVFWWPLRPPGEGFGREVLPEAPLPPGGQVTVETDWSAWYQIAIHVPGATPHTLLPLCATVER